MELGSPSQNLIKRLNGLIEVKYCMLKLVDMALGQRIKPTNFSLIPKFLRDPK